MIIAFVFENKVLRKMGLREMRKQWVLKYRVMIKILILFVPSKALFKLHLSSSGVTRFFEAWGNQNLWLPQREVTNFKKNHNDYFNFLLFGSVI
jgi:hypothetical protein